MKLKIESIAVLSLLISLFPGYQKIELLMYLADTQMATASSYEAYP
jgi:hypothetical protein